MRMLGVIIDSRPRSFSQEHLKIKHLLPSDVHSVLFEIEFYHGSVILSFTYT